MTTTYTYKMPWGETLRFTLGADHSESICVENADGEYEPTPIRRDNTGNDERVMLRRVIEHLGAEWYWNRDEHDTAKEALAAALKGAQRVDSE